MSPTKKIKWLLDPRACPGFERFDEAISVQKGVSIHYTQNIIVKLPERYALVNITDLVEDILRRSSVSDGLCFVSAKHITAGIYINDAESGLLQDLSSWLEQLAPYGLPYRHHLTGEDNGDAHLKSFITNHCATIPVTQGRCDFGPWQQIFYAEYDGLRSKKILVKIVGI